MSLGKFTDYSELDFEFKLLHFIINNEHYRDLILPIASPRLFKDEYAKILSTINSLKERKNEPISLYTIHQELSKTLDNKETLKKIEKMFVEIDQLGDVLDENIDLDYFIDESVAFIKSSSIKSAVYSSIEIIETKPEKMNTLPDLFSDALAVDIDTNRGLELSAKTLVRRLERYKHKDERVRFSIPSLNKVTEGGFPRKTLNLLMAATNRGKTSVMCSLAADYIRLGYNVIYITLEMGEYHIAAKIDSNLLNIPISKLGESSEETFKAKYEDFVQSCVDGIPGKLIIKEYPTASINSNDLKRAIKEIRQKEKITPDVLILDYINLMNSARSGKNDKTYEKVKSLSEELRGLAVEQNLVLLSATQTNRSGINNEEIGLEHTSDSMGLPFTSDFAAALFSNKAMREDQLLTFTVIKNRYSGFVDKRLCLGMDFDYSRLFALDIELEKKLAISGVNLQSDEDSSLFRRPTAFSGK